MYVGKLLLKDLKERKIGRERKWERKEGREKDVQDIYRENFKMLPSFINWRTYSGKDINPPYLF